MELSTECQCQCANCGEIIDYRSTQAGQIVQCPKCGEKSQLPAPAKLLMLEFFGPPAPEFKNCEVCGLRMKFWTLVCPVCEKERRKKQLYKRLAIGVSSVALLAVIGATVLLTRHFQKSKPIPKPKLEPAPMATAAPRIFLAQPQPQLPKSSKDLHPHNFALERPRGDTSAFVAGDIRNDSLNVHHHVRADVDLLDKNGVKIGTVSDYFVDLGANQTWHFIVPVTDTNAMSIRFAGFKED